MSKSQFKLKEHLNVVDADSHFLRILPIVSRKARKARKEKMRHYYLCITYYLYKVTKSPNYIF